MAEALHLWSQVVGKIRLSLTPWVNHSWHVPLYVSARGLTTGLIPPRGFDMEFDFLGDALVIRVSGGRQAHVALTQQSVAAFYANVVKALKELEIGVRINPMPCELSEAVPFHSDDMVRAYDGETARAWWLALVQTQRVFHIFRTRFVGKCSPIHMFWGSFDLAVTRFSGRKAPPHPGGMPHMPDAVARDAYDQEVSSAGFWPGGGAVTAPSYYSYAYPAPQGFAQARTEPDAAGLPIRALGEFFMPCLRRSAQAPIPDATLAIRN